MALHVKVRLSRGSRVWQGKTVHYIEAETIGMVEELTARGEDAHDALGGLLLHCFDTDMFDVHLHVQPMEVQDG